MHFRAAFANVQAHMSLAESASDAGTAARQSPDAVGFSEVGGMRKAAVMRARLAAKGLRLVRLPGPASAVPAAYRLRRWQKVEAYAVPLSPATDVGSDGAGPSRLREKEATVLVLRARRSRRVVVFIVCHLAPSPYLNARRATLHADQIAVLADLVRRLREERPHAEVVLVGDLNTASRVRLAPLVDAGLVLAPFVATHGRNPIDHVASTIGKGRARTVRLRSDHDLLVVDL